MEKIRNAINWLRSHLVVTGIIMVLFIFISALVYELVIDDQSTNTLQPPQEIIASLSLPNVFPKPGVFPVGGSTSSISLFFSDPVNVQSVRLAVQPTIELEITTLKSFPDQIAITPKTPWVTGMTYSITILKGARSIPAASGESETIEYAELAEDITLQYIITPLIKEPLHPGPI